MSDHAALDELLQRRPPPGDVQEALKEVSLCLSDVGAALIAGDLRAVSAWKEADSSESSTTRPSERSGSAEQLRAYVDALETADIRGQLEEAIKALQLGRERIQPFARDDPRAARVAKHIDATLGSFRRLTDPRPLDAGERLRRFRDALHLARLLFRTHAYACVIVWVVAGISQFRPLLEAAEKDVSAMLGLEMAPLPELTLRERLTRPSPSLPDPSAIHEPREDGPLKKAWGVVKRKSRPATLIVAPLFGMAWLVGLMSFTLESATCVPGLETWTTTAPWTHWPGWPRWDWGVEALRWLVSTFRLCVRPLGALPFHLAGWSPPGWLADLAVLMTRSFGVASRRTRWEIERTVGHLALNRLTTAQRSATRIAAAFDVPLKPFYEVYRAVGRRGAEKAARYAVRSQEAQGAGPDLLTSPEFRHVLTTATYWIWVLPSMLLAHLTLCLVIWLAATLLCGQVEPPITR